MEHNLEFSRFSGQISRVVLLGESDVHDKLIADIVSDDLILKSGNERARTENEILSLGRAAFKSHAVNGPSVVDENGVSVLRRSSLNGLESVILFRKPL